MRLASAAAIALAPLGFLTWACASNASVDAPTSAGDARHALVIDGVYSSTSPLAPPIFHAASPLTDQDVVAVTTVLHRRILRYLRRLGRLPRDEQDESSQPEPDEPLFAQICAASVQGRVALGPRRGTAVERIGRRRGDDRPLFMPGRAVLRHRTVLPARQGPDRGHRS